MSEKKEKYPSDLAERFQLRLPPGLRDRIKAYAERHGRSMNAEIVRLLEREFPKPWTVDSRISDLLKMLLIIRQGSSDERLFNLTKELEETVFGIMNGQALGADYEAVNAMDSRWQQYCEERLEDDHDELNLDPEEAEQIGKSGTTAKYVDIDEPDRLKHIKSIIPDLRDEHIESISRALVVGNAEKVLETVGKAVRRQKLEEHWANNPNSFGDDIEF